MGTEENTQIAQDVFAAIGRGDLPGLLTLLDETVEWEVPGQWALAGTYRGHAGLTDFFERSSGILSFSYPEPLDFVGQADRVLAIGYATGTFKATNRPFVDKFVITLTFKHGKVTQVHEYIDTLAIALASGSATLTEPDRAA
jgi:ketosteroid isomerase-like protein